MIDCSSLKSNYRRPSGAQWVHNAFETTLSGKGYRKKIYEWKKQGYEIIIYFFKLPSVEFAIERVKLRVSNGGHNVPEQDIRRRFERSWNNFNKIYKPLADS